MEQLCLIATPVAAPLSLDLRFSLSTMNFLEFAVWGSWFVVLGQYLHAQNFTGKQIGRVYATMALGSIFSPIFVGSVADRYFHSEHLMVALHLVGAILLFCMAKTKTPRRFYWVALAYALAYAPTLALSNSIIFAHIPDATRDFPMIRVLGTIGWIAANLSLKLFLKPGQPVSNRPLLLASALSLVLAIQSLTLPGTPPPENAVAIPFLSALELLKDPSFGVFFGISFLIAIALAFYFSFTSLYLEQGVGIRSDIVGPLMTLGQWSEIFFMVFLSWFLQTLGMKWVLVLGMTAWGLRYGLFAIGKPMALVVIGVALHGICFDFFFAAGFIHVQNAAPQAINASAQSLFVVLTYGLGMYLGTEASGWLNHYFTTETTDPQTGATVKSIDWRKFWLVPCGGVIVALVPFVFLFNV